MLKSISLFGCAVVIVTVVGCSQSATEPTTETAAPTSAVDGTQFVLTEEPEGASDVIQIREDSADGDDVVIVGRIGGSENPWIDQQAAFTIVDNSLKACSDIPGDLCETPWDYCCQTDLLPTATALIKVVDDEGKLVSSDARELLDVKELSTVVVKGKAQRDDEGNLTVLASGVFVKKK